MLTLRFKREGAKKKGIFRIIATDNKRSAVSGKALEILGWWDPKKHTSSINKEKIKNRIKQGAILSPGVHNLLVKNKIIADRKLATHKKGKAKEGVVEDTIQAPVETEESPEKPPEAVAEETNN